MITLKVAIYGDVHLTKKMNRLQEIWEESAIEVFSSMYDSFSKDRVDIAICLGDFFDAPRLEAKSVKLVTKVLSIIDKSPFPTYFLLGNHEIFDDESNILDYLSEYQNIIPITSLTTFYDELMLIPYNVNIEEIKPLMKDKYVFTHCDIYGSSLSSGKVRANFGVDPSILSDAKYVFNGHVHLNSIFANVYNVGSLLKSQQGELLNYEEPTVYYLYTDSSIVESKVISTNLVLPLTCKVHEVSKLLAHYDSSNKFILRIEYTDESEFSEIDKFLGNSRVLKVTKRKLIENSLDNTEYSIVKTTLDIKELLSEYINKDIEVQPEDKERLINLGLELLEV